MTPETTPTTLRDREPGNDPWAALRKRHVEKRSWPFYSGQANIAADGYRHWCAYCKVIWPCDAATLLATLDAAREQAATEARRELLAKVEGLRDDDRVATDEGTDDGGWQYVQWLRETAVRRLIEEQP